jgi:hypothetical protein
MSGSLYGVWLYGKGYYSALPTVDVAGNLPVTPVLAGSLGAVVALGGALQPTVQVTGWPMAVMGLSGSLPIPVALYGTLNNPVTFDGALIAQVALTSGSFPLTLALSGQLVPVATPYADVTYSASFSGNCSGLVDLANPPVIAGPLWVADPLCPDPGWQAEELCSG